MAAVIFTNLRQVTAALERKAGAFDDNSRRVAQAAVLIVERRAKQNLAARSHRKGTPTPSQPGQPPAKVSGGLGRSVVSTPAEHVGLAAWRARVGVARGSEANDYAQIQEKGGAAGRGGATELLARPYFGPAFRWLLESGALAVMHAEAMRDALRR